MKITNQSGSSFKNRVLLVAFILTSIFIFIFVTLIYIAQQENAERTKREFKIALGNSVEQTINSTVETYSLLAKTILETTKAKELMKEDKREELYSLVESTWKSWNTNNPDFEIMVFHKADGTAFLRMHKPESYGDYLADVRPMVKAAHEQKKLLIGYETGKFSTVFRILTPIFYKGEYLGSLDFGIHPDYIVEKIEKFKHYNGAIFVKDESLKLFKNKSSIDFNGYSLQSKTDLETERLLKTLPQSYNFQKEEKIKVNETYYSTYAHRMPDYADAERAQLLFFYNTTDTINSQKKFMATLALASIIFVILMFFLLNNSFNRLIKSQIKMSNAHSLEIQKKEQQLFTQSRMAQMGEMISMIAHQWRQPLGAIAATSIDLSMKMELEIFNLEQKDEREACQAYFNNGLKEIDGLVQNLTHTIDDFRNFYKPEKESDSSLINEPVTKALNIIKATLVSDGIEVDMQCICDKEVKIYTNEMMQVILNILKNAQDNFKEKRIKNPKITISSNCDIGDEMILEICDNGGGIPEEILPKIFDPYFSTKDERNGTGLGLYMSKTIIEDHHNGKLQVSNRDGGACFTIVLKQENSK